MDELDLLKDDWQKGEDKYPKLSYDEIYKMLLKKSSSVVKWIFYISVGELLLALILPFALRNDKHNQNAADMNIDGYFLAFEIITLGVLLYFMYRFYRNYKKISVTDNAKTLLKNIINTRKTVKNYIMIVLFLSGILAIFSFTTVLMGDNELNNQLFANASGMTEVLIWAIAIAVMLVIIAVVLLLCWLIYQLLYGLLLRRLTANYNEIKQLEL